MKYYYINQSINLSIKRPSFTGAANNVMEIENTNKRMCEKNCYCKSIDWKPLSNKCSLNAEKDED